MDSLHRAIEDSISDGYLEYPLTAFVSYGKFALSLDYLSAAARAGAGWIVESDGVLTVVPLPKVHFDSRYRLHSDSGPSVEWFDGSRSYHWHGVQTPRKYIQMPESIGAGEIMAIRNAELRRVVIERFGMERFIEESNAEILDTDVDYAGQRQLIRVELPGDEPIVAVRVICPSTRRNCLLRVPPNLAHCAEAIAWTFGLAKQGYEPTVET